MTRIAFIGFGEAGQTWARSLLGAGQVSVSAHDTAIGDKLAAIQAAAQDLGVALADSAAAACAGADIIISAVTAASQPLAAQVIADCLRPGQVLVDINSVSPGRKAQAAALVRASGGDYVDMAVMAPVSLRAHRVPVLVAGTLPAGFEALLTDLGFDWTAVGPEPGQATAVKMIRSLFVKGLEAITVEALTAARAAGCLDDVLGSLSGSFAALGWPEFATYQFERMLTHGIRRAEEMEESARALAEFGRPEAAALAAAIAASHRMAGAAGIRVAAEPDLADLARLLAETSGNRD